MAGARERWGLTSRQLVMVLILMVGSFVMMLNQTVVTPAFPSIMEDMRVDAASVQWLTTGFTLVNAIMIPVTAYLIDRFSVKGLVIVSMCLFAVGSLLAAAAPIFLVLLIGRLVQAACAGVLMPMTMTVLMMTFPIERRGLAMGLYGVVIAFAPAVGPTIAGIVIDMADWRIMFWGIAALSIATMLSAMFAMERSEPGEAPYPLDKPSLLLSTFGLGLLLYGFSIVGSVGFGYQTVAAVVVGVALVALFCRRQLHLEHPMLRIQVLTNRVYLIGTAIAMVVQASLLSMGILIPIYLQTLLGYSATVSGLVMLPGALLMGAMGPIAGKLFDRHGPRTLALLGTAMLTLANTALAFLGVEASAWYVSAVIAVRMMGLGLVNMPITTWAMNALPTDLVPHGTAVNNTLRQVSGTMATAILVSVYALVSAACEGSMPYVEAHVAGVDTAFAITSALCLVALVLVVVFVKDQTPVQEVEQLQAEAADDAQLEQVMRRDVYVVPETATVLEAMTLLVDKGVSGVPVVDADQRAVGFLSDGDVMRLLSSRSHSYVDPIVLISQYAQENESFDQRLDSLMRLNVREVATKGVIGVSVHADLSEVCRVLGDNHLKKVPVLDGSRVVGVVNRSDVTRYSMRAYLQARGMDT